MAGFEILGSVLGLLGSGLSAVAAIQQGKYENAVAKAQAKAMEQRAMEERASSQREADARRKNAALVMSRQRAIAGASGGGTDDTTMLDLFGDTASAGETDARYALYEGETRGRGLEFDAGLRRAAGRQAKRNATFAAIGYGLSGFTGVIDGWSRYGGGGNRMPQYSFG